MFKNSLKEKSLLNSVIKLRIKLYSMCHPELVSGSKNILLNLNPLQRTEILNQIDTNFN